MPLRPSKTSLRLHKTPLAPPESSETHWNTSLTSWNPEKPPFDPLLTPWNPLKRPGDPLDFHPAKPLRCPGTLWNNTPEIPWNILIPNETPLRPCSQKCWFKTDLLKEGNDIDLNDSLLEQRSFSKPQSYISSNFISPQTFWYPLKPLETPWITSETS